MFGIEIPGDQIHYIISIKTWRADMQLFKLNASNYINLEQIVSIKKSGRGLTEGEYILHFADGRKMNLSGEETISRFETYINKYMTG
jgi:hypothetical protein